MGQTTILITVDTVKLKNGGSSQSCITVSQTGDGIFLVYPSNPENDPQYNLWETGIQRWLKNNYLPCTTTTVADTQISTSTPQHPIEIATTTIQ